MITKYTYGNPFQTDAVVQKLEVQNGNVPYFTVVKTEEQLQFEYTLENEEKVYGLGENVRGINKRGWIYKSCCADEPNHVEDRTSLYASHNFLVLDGGKEQFGVFFDYPGIITFDVGYTHLNELKITLSEPDADVYVMTGESILDIVKQFRQLIGRSYIPPKWAFGYQQSRWGYMNEDDIREVVKGHREKKIPLESIYMDIDYMERFKDFTVNQERFPDFPEFVKEMKAQHIHLVPIIDAGVKVEEGYDVYEEGIEKGYFCKKENGEYFVAGVWPGKVHFPDVLNKEAREWFGNKYQVLLDQGIEGFWNDMNEPSIFFAQDRMDETFDKIAELKDKNLDLDTFQQFTGLVGSLANNTDDFKKFYHNVDGKMMRHDKVHNLFGYNMTRAAGEAFERLSPEKRILMFSRSSYIGMHRYGGIWTGDNKSWWNHLLLNLRMMPSLNMVGILYTGADIGGFGADATEDLVMRWIQLAMFSPLMRNHSAMGTRKQEVYRFDHVEEFRKIINIRYGLLAYIYSEYMKSALNSEMYFKPLSFVYTDDEFASQVEDQLLVGDSLMIAPVYNQNAKGRYVYLPEEMAMLRFRGVDDYDTEILPAGHHYVEAGLFEMLVFVRPDKILVLTDGGEYADEVDCDHVKALAFVKTKAEYVWYEDDGMGKDYENPDNYGRITIEKGGNCVYTGSREKKIEVKLL
ncbi:glycoside hydrolase family 31 protein [Blautia stercoris]|uniref:Alpha-glucosidase n=1 Tax=Blautia stercoris TaxID=871664 RepID=A0ABR7PAZ6_9FIRM|nr:TIM-barrel domain-containing protein [Blautia stercoris]MBC8628610.1 alpha-glucosidase [Blautia stercoris]